MPGRTRSADSLFKDILEDNPYVAMRILIIRMMMEHRGIDRQEIATELGCSREKVSTAIRGTLYRFSYEEKEGYRYNSMELGALMRNLDDIEDAITSITAKAGGIRSMCGCTDEAIQTITRYLNGDQTARDAHGEYVDYD